MERRKKILLKTKEINANKGSIRRENEIRLPNIRSHSSLLPKINKSTKNQNGESPTDSGSTMPTSGKQINRCRSMLQMNNPNSPNFNHSNNETPSASFMSPERGELFPIKDINNRNEQRFVGIPN